MTHGTVVHHLAVAIVPTIAEVSLAFVLPSLSFNILHLFDFRRLPIHFSAKNFASLSFIITFVSVGSWKSGKNTPKTGWKSGTLNVRHIILYQT